MSLPKVFFDMTADGEQLGRITIEVSEDATNFFLVGLFSTVNAEMAKSRTDIFFTHRMGTWVSC